MATPTQTPNHLDPDEQEYEQNFDFERQRRTRADNQRTLEDGRSKGGGNWSRDKRSVSEREAAPSWDTNLGGQSGGGKGKGSMATQMAKKRAKQWIIGSLASLIFGIAVSTSAGVTSMIGKVTSLMSDWGNKNNNSFFSKRTAKYMQKKLFNADAKCEGGVKCRYKEGISQKEIDKMKKQGLNPEVGKDGDKQYLKSFDTVDETGKKVRVDASNFETNYKTNTSFRAKLDSIAKPKAMLMRGQQTISKVFNKFGIQRNQKIDGANDKERTKKFRSTIYGQENANAASTGVDAGDAEDAATKAVGDADESLKKAIETERVNLTKDDFSNPPSIVPDVTDLDLPDTSSADVMNNAVREQLTTSAGLKSAAQGMFGLISKACGAYQILRTVEFGAKVWKVIGLIKYMGIFMTIMQKVQAGDGSVGTELAYIMGILMKPSTKKDSKGKTFWQSEGFNLMFQGKIADHRGLARFTTGTSFLKFIQGAKQYLESMGANKATCKQVNSWYGQLLLTLGGLALDFFSGGSFSVAGIAGGFALGMVFSVIIAYATPLLIQYAVGTVAPDPTDAEGGYGAGNAIGAAMGAFGGFTGKSNGGRVLGSGEAAAVEMESNKEMAFENKVDNLGKSPFSLDSDTSIPSQLALAAMPYISAPFSSSSFQSLASIVASPLSLFGSSFSSLLTKGVNAQADVDRGGEFCADEDYRSMDVAVDAFCNPIAGEQDAIISSTQYSPDAVLDYMLKNGHIEDDEEGTPKSDDFKKYLASCVDGVAPISPDGGGIDVGEDIDTRWCMDKDVKFTMFRFFIADGAIDTAHTASVNGTLGQDESGGAAAGSAGAAAMTAEQCKTATNRGDQIACNAQLFTPYYYLYGGGHGSIDQIKKYITDAKNGDNKGAAILDCSGFVRTVYYMTLGVDVGAGTANGQAHSSHFKPINDADAKPGDVVWHSSPFDHIAIVTANDPATKTFTIIQAPRTGKPISSQKVKYNEYQAFTYTGN